MTTGWRLLLAAGAGGALGSVLRVGVSLAILGWLGPVFPWGTLIVNTAGSLAIGWIAARGVGGRAMRAFLVAGLCGGFTTFSVFSLETLALTRESPALAGLYVAVSVPLWLGAVWAGWRLGRQPQPST
jgi:fluoride exporter